MPIEFHFYGLIIGIALVTGLFLIEKRATQVGIKFKHYYLSLSLVLVCGIVGARIWHVVTDWALYGGEFGRWVNGVWQWQLGAWWRIFEVWNGGLSILGAVAGGVVGLWGMARLNGLKLKLLLDLVIFGLPIAQSIGRWGNYLNQELYGWVTNLPWGIFIEATGQKHHPLFLYESLLTLGFGLVVWWRRDKIKVGTGKLFWSYVLYYSVVRFGLDFLRVEGVSREVFGWQVSSFLGSNQAFLLGIILVSAIMLFLQSNSKRTQSNHEQ